MKKIICIMIIVVMITTGMGFAPISFGGNSVFSENCIQNIRGTNTQRSYSSNCNLSIRLIPDKQLNDTMESLLKDKHVLYTSNDRILLYWMESVGREPNDKQYFYLSRVSLPDGNLIWTKEIKSYFDTRHTQIFNDNLYVLFSDSLSSFDMSTGNENWNLGLSDIDDSDADFIVCEKGIFLCNRNKLKKINLETGNIDEDELIYNIDNDEQFFIKRYSIAIKDNYLVILGSGLFCFDISNLAPFWRIGPYGLADHGISLYAANWYSPIITGDNIIIRQGWMRESKPKPGEKVEFIPEGFYAVLGLKNGKVKYKIDTDFMPRSNYCANDKYLFCKGLGVYNITTGKKLWRDNNQGGYSSSRDNVFFIGNKVACLTEIPHDSEHYGPLYDKLSIMDINTGHILFNMDVFDHNSRPSVEFIEIGGSIIFRHWNKFYKPAADSLTFQINSNTYKPDNDEKTEMDSKPTILQDRTYLPARYVTEPLGGQVFWDGEERKVTCKLVAPDNAETEEYKENVVELWIGKSTAKVNGVEVQIDPDNPDVVPTIINDRTMVPMRFLAESLGCSVEWIADTKEIILTYTP